MLEQEEAAKQCMIEWLSHENELGKKPYQIKKAGEFDWQDLHYYIFKFKKSMFSSWLVGVCGGYHQDDLGHCGHIFSEMSLYNEKTAENDCIQMVENIKTYWKSEAKKHDQLEDKNTFVDFVLLKNANVDLMDVFECLKKYVTFKDVERNDKNVYVTNVGNSMIALSLIETPIPDGEAEYYAQGCYMWKDAVEKVKEHQAHIIVSTIGKDLSTIDAKLLHSQLVDACLYLSKAIAVYGQQVVFSADIYHHVMNDYYQKKVLPIFIWIYLGIISQSNKNSVYTIGLKDFGHYEIEILPSQMKLSQLHEFLWNVVVYIIEQHAQLHDGETIGMSATQKCQITLSQGLFLDEETLKIEVVEE